MRTKWSCSNCQMSSDRHYNVRRHIQRRHGGIGEPVSDDTLQYYKDINPQNYLFPIGYSHHASLSFLTRKEKPRKDFSDVLEHQFLQPVRKVVELKNLVSQLFTIQPQQQRMMSGDGVYPTMTSTTFDAGESKNNLSEHSRFEDDDYSEVVGYRGRV